MRVDIHVHTWYSGDGLTPPELLLRVAKRRGLDALFITDHNRLTRIRSKDFPVFPGEEVMTTKGELLALGIQEEIPPYLPPGETVDRIHEQGGLAIVPHPFDAFRRRTALLLRTDPPPLDGVEVLNARYVSSVFLARAYTFAREAHLPMLGGSDAHGPWEVGNAYTILPDGLEELDDVLRAIRRGDSRPGGHLSSPLVHIPSFLARWFKPLLFKPRGAPLLI